MGDNDSLTIQTEGVAHPPFRIYFVPKRAAQMSLVLLVLLAGAAAAVKGASSENGSIYQTIAASDYIVETQVVRVFARDNLGKEAALAEGPIDSSYGGTVVVELAIKQNGVLKSSPPALPATIEVPLTLKSVLSMSLDRNGPPQVRRNQLAALQGMDGIFMVRRSGGHLAPTVDKFWGGFFFAAGIRNRIEAIIQRRPESARPFDRLEDVLPLDRKPWHPDAAGLAAQARIAQIVAQRMREGVAHNWRGVLDSLNLRPDQSEKIESLWGIEGVNAHLQVLAAREANASPEQVGNAARSVRARTKSREAAILGPTGYAQLREARDLSPDASTIDLFRNALEDYGIAQFTASDRLALARILRANIPTSPSPYDAAPLGATLNAWEVRILQSSKGILSPAAYRIWADESPWRLGFHLASAEDTRRERDLERRHQRAHMYRDVIYYLNLPPTKLDRLKDLLAEGGLLSPHASRTVIKPEIVQLIGVEKADRLKIAGELYFYRARVDEGYGWAMEDRRLPLTDSQSHQLTMASFESYSAAVNPEASKPDYLSAAGPEWISAADRAFIEKANGFLSAGQVDVLRHFLADHNEYRALKKQYPQIDVGPIPSWL